MLGFYSFFAMISAMKKKLVITISASILLTVSLVIGIPFIVLAAKTATLDADYSYLKNDDHYKSKVEVEGLELVKQHVSCGYATIEMLSSFYGNKVSEDDLDAKNKTITTSSSNGFLKEINKAIPSKKYSLHSYLKNDMLLKEIHISLTGNNPVAIEWAAKYEDEWTLHFSIISGLDIANDNVEVYNPYGYIENITIDELLERTSFKAYENMPLFLNFGFAFGAFDKNAIFFAK